MITGSPLAAPMSTSSCLSASSRPPIELEGRKAIDPVPARPTAVARARSSSRSLSREGTGRPSLSRWVGAADDEIPAAPASMASVTNATMPATSASVAGRLLASGPITHRRRLEWPT